MKNIRIVITKFLIPLACALAYLAPAHATSVLPLLLDEIVGTSAVAFEGTCTGNRTERDPATQLVVTYTTFQVRDVLKGTVGATYEIKQIGGTLSDGRAQFRVEGVPTFAPGQDYVVFLAGVSAAGFSSPIGLSQGKFSIHGAAAGGRQVANGRDFKEMTARMPSRLPAPALARMQQAAGAVREMDLADFKQAVRNQLGAVR